jgi:hypothetical protein
MCWSQSSVSYTPNSRKTSSSSAAPTAPASSPVGERPASPSRVWCVRAARVPDFLRRACLTQRRCMMQDPVYSASPIASVSSHLATSSLKRAQKPSIMSRSFLGRDGVRDRQRSVHEGDFDTGQDHMFVFTDESEAAQLAQDVIEKQRRAQDDKPPYKQLVGTPTEFKDNLIQFGFQLPSEQLTNDEVTALAQLISPDRRRTSAATCFPFSLLEDRSAAGEVRLCGRCCADCVEGQVPSRHRDLLRRRRAADRAPCSVR